MADISRYRDIDDPFAVARRLIGWDPFSMERWRSGDGRGMDFLPRFDIREQDDAWVIEADMPGVKEEDVEVTVSGNQLTVSGRRESKVDEERENYHLVERSHGSFHRTFTLPSEVDIDNANASLDGGVLVLSIPKRPEAKPRKISLAKKLRDKLGRSS